METRSAPRVSIKARELMEVSTCAFPGVAKTHKNNVSTCSYGMLQIPGRRSLQLQRSFGANNYLGATNKTRFLEY